MRTKKTALQQYFKNIYTEYPYWNFENEGIKYKMHDYIYSGIFSNSPAMNFKTNILTSPNLIKIS